MLLLAAVTLAIWVWRSNEPDTTFASVDYSTFYDWLLNDQIESVVIAGPKITGSLRSAEKTAEGATKAFYTVRPDGDDSLLPLLRKQRVQIAASTEQRSFAWELLATLLPWVLILGFGLWVSNRARNTMTGGGPLGAMLKNKSRKFEKTMTVGATFEDVAGLTAAKRDLQEIILFLKEPTQFRRLGGKVPRGVLLVGPPGTGKTLLARATAGESGVPFFSISASEFIEMFVGVGAARVRDLFAESKKHAPSIVFIDEIDAIGRSRGTGFGGGHDEREQTLNQLLSEMDGFDRNDLTIVIAATNRPDVLDPALLRPGRFDRRVIVDRPEPAARRAILEVHAKNIPLAENVNLEAIAKNAPGFSGADLANLVNEAALQATRRGADAVDASDFSDAFDKIILGDPTEAILGPEEKRRIAVHESGHAIVAQFSPAAEPLHRVTIIPRGMALGVTQQTPGQEYHILTQPQLESRLRILMAGYAAERHVFGSVSTGAENDLKVATGLASKMVAHYGMSKNLGAVYYDHNAEHPFLGQRIATDGGASDATTQAIELEARKLLAKALEEAEQLLKKHRTQLDALERLLLDKETLEKEELRTLLVPSPAARNDAGLPREVRT